MTISRRHFLRNAFAGATLVATGIDLKALGQVRHEQQVGSGSITHANHPPITGHVVMPDDPQYDDLRRNYNGRFDVKPSSILLCDNENDVCQAVKWARHNHMPVTIRSGGHSYEAFSLQDGGALIDMSKMSKIVYNRTSKTATIESGVRLMPLYEAMWEQGCVIPAGSCGTVGVAGLTLGGGFGLLARHMGLTCDNLIGVRLVDANSKIWDANEDTHSDLLWACRGGGGGSFGVVTHLTYRTHPIGNVTVFRLKWHWDEMADVIKAWQEWAPHVDDRITSVLTLTSKAADSLSCIGIFQGGPAGAKALLKPLIAQVKPYGMSVTMEPFIEAARRFSGFRKAGPAPKVKPPPETVHAHPQTHTRFKNCSDYARTSLDEKAIETIVNFLTESPCDSSCLQFDSYGGAINRVPVKNTAFCHRGDTKFCLHYQISWRHAADDERNAEWVTDFRKAMKPHVSGFNYVNYCDLKLENWAHSYYGENLERLVEIKQKYDPDDFFHFAQSVPLKQTAS